MSLLSYVATLGTPSASSVPKKRERLEAAMMIISSSHVLHLPMGNNESLVGILWEAQAHKGNPEVELIDTIIPKL